MTRLTGWRVTQRGVIAALVLIALAVVLFYAIVAVQQRGEAARREEAIQIALENLEEEAAGPAVIAVAPPEQPATDQGQPVAPTTPTPAPTPSVLPETGPEVWTMLPLALLTYSIALYLTSARTAPKTRLSSVFRVK